MSKVKTTEKFISEAKNKHGNKYNYDMVVYISATEKVIIICLKHGEFLQTPDNHLHNHGCPNCGDELSAQKQKLSTQELIKFQENMLQRNIKVDISNYENAHTKLPCECLKCAFLWKASLHKLKFGRGCRKCGDKSGARKRRKTILDLEQFQKNMLTKNIIININNYKNAHTKLFCICLICRYEWKVSYHTLMQGNGCENCKKSHGEKVSRFILEILLNTLFPSIKLKMEKDKRRKLELDCYSEKLKLAFEVQGLQHHQFTPRFHKTLKDFREQQERDLIKKQYCKENNIILIEIDNTKGKRTFMERVQLVKSTLQEYNISFEDIKITEEMYYQHLRDKQSL